MAYAAITKPGSYMNTKLYTGTGAIQAITGVEFQPDLNWTKCRTVSQSHVVTDAVRGVTETLYTNAAQAETTEANGLTAFGADGFTVGTSDMWSDNTETFVSWNWKAGTTSGLSGGTLTPSAYSINTTSGFGIYAYTGTGTSATIAHGLGAVPKVIIIKRLDSATTGDWFLHHGSLAGGNSLFFNSENAQDTSNYLGTPPTSSVFTVGTSAYVNGSTNTYIAYCFTDVKGYSKAGSYTGNAAADGPFCYTGFKPSVVIIKNAAAGSTPWFIFDDKRNPSNETDLKLNPNANAIEASANPIDILSNGFKLRTSGSYNNGSGNLLVYIAFASEPLVANVGSFIPATAR